MKSATSREDRVTQIANQYLEFLAAEGYRPQRDGEEKSADITFRAHGAWYRLSVDEADQDFLSLSLCYDLEEGLPMERLLQVANEGNEYWKVVKVTVQSTGEAVRFQFEAFGRLTSELLQRALHILREAATRFFTGIQDCLPPRALA